MLVPTAILWAGFAAFPLGPAAAEKPPDARAVVQHADTANTPPALVEHSRMILTDEHGRTFERRLILWAARREGGDLELLRFLSPDELRGAGLLTHEHRGGEDEQWLYLPATRRIRRISGTGRRNRFMGTEFLFEDLQGFHPEDHTYRMLDRETVDGEPCFVIEERPRNPEAAARTAYSREILWIGTRTLALRRAVMFDREGHRLKKLTITGIEEVRPGIFLPRTLRMENLRNGRRTTLETLERTLPDHLEDHVFSRRNLRRRLRPDER